MRARPVDLDDEHVIGSVADGWGVQAESVCYVPEGGGSHHWKVVDRRGHAWFVTVDDLDDKDWFGDTREEVFDGLQRSLATAVALRHGAALGFVVAPVPNGDDEIVRRLGSRYAVAVYPYLIGESYPFGPYTDPDRRAGVLDMVIAMHAATAIVGGLPPSHALSVSRRGDLDAFLEDPHRPWEGGPFSDAGHDLLVSRAVALGDVVGAFDQLVEMTAGVPSALVVTHGEPHPANVMSVGGGLVLIDWDTVGLAPPERDLWLLAADGGDDVTRSYVEATGRRIDPATMTLYRLRWYLDDVASAVRLFRNRHERTADTQRWWDGLAPRIDALDAWVDALR